MKIKFNKRFIKFLKENGRRKFFDEKVGEIDDTFEAKQIVHFGFDTYVIKGKDGKEYNISVKDANIIED